MKSNRIASIIIKSNRELGESFQAYLQPPLNLAEFGVPVAQGGLKRVCK